MKGKDSSRIKAAIEELTKASHKLAEEVYKQTAPKQQGPAQETSQEQDTDERRSKADKETKEKKKATM